MGQVIQGPWKPRAEGTRAQPAVGTSQCTIIRLRPPRPRPTEAMVQARLSMVPEGGKAVSIPAL